MHSPIILFDGVCNLCNGAVQFVLSNDANNAFKFASLQSEFAQDFLKNHQLPTQNFDTLILIENEEVFIKSKAVFKIVKYLPKYSWLNIFKFLPVFISDFFYDIVSQNRLKWFGQRESCWLPTEDLKERFL
ncbi:MAG: DCC1-like thiol-disulfide oxidoreductase family protein [Leadbetterella sp.]|nr:DCC1-like thiol-disulfide oxidoreductase family protein [Leadbetterella sp.]